MDIKDLLPLMHQYKVRRAKLGALEVELDATAFVAAPEKAPEAPAIPVMPLDFTFYSVADQSPLATIERIDAPTPEVKS